MAQAPNMKFSAVGTSTPPAGMTPQEAEQAAREADAQRVAEQEKKR